MSKFLQLMFLSLAMLLFGASARAEDVSGYPIGKCDGELNTTSKVKHPTAGDWVSSAVYINPETAATIGGNHIDQMHVGLCSTIHVEKVSVWVRSELSGENLVETTVDVDALQKGWNMIDLETPYNIPTDGKGFYLGYSILQDGRCAGPALLKEPGNGSFYYQPGEAEWEDKSDEYTLCLEGMVYGDNLPKYNVTLNSVTPQPVFIMSDGNLKCVASVRNRGTIVVTGLDFKVEVSDAAEPVTAHADCSIPFGEIGEVAFTVNPVLTSAPESCDMKVTVTAVNGNADEDATDNNASASFSVMEDAFPRTVIVEEFTTERCPNCPAAATKLHSILENPKYSDNVVAVCHHAGYYYDSFTTDFDKEYEWFYNANGGTYAPAMMLDRTPTVESSTPVFFPSSEAMLSEEIDKRLGFPSTISVNVKASKNDKELSATVSGKRIGDADGDLYVTIFLVENDVKAIDQSGSGEGYLHQHINRAVNSTWGTPLEWSGDEYTSSCTFKLDDSWNFNNMEIIAMVNRYDANDPNNCAVENAGRVYLSESGVEDIVTEGERTVTGYYDMTGRRLSEKPANGIYITTYSDGSALKSVR